MFLFRMNQIRIPAPFALRCARGSAAARNYFFACYFINLRILKTNFILQRAAIICMVPALVGRNLRPENR